MEQSNKPNKLQSDYTDNLTGMLPNYQNKSENGNNKGDTKPDLSYEAIIMMGLEGLK